jgi:hypothetical protein
MHSVPYVLSAIAGCTECAGTYAPAPTERVHTVLSWIQQLVIERIHAGGIKAPAPVQSRIHQVLSDSMLGYEHCKCATTLCHCAACYLSGVKRPAPAWAALLCTLRTSMLRHICALPGSALPFWLSL